MIVPDKWAKQWIDAINRRDVELLMSLYAADTEVRSPFAKLLTKDGVVKGKEAQRAYLAEQVRRMPSVQLELVAVYAGHLAIAIHHRDTLGRNTIETMLFNEQDEIMLHTACLDRVR